MKQKSRYFKRLMDKHKISHLNYLQRQQLMMLLLRKQMQNQQKLMLLLTNQMQNQQRLMLLLRKQNKIIVF